MNNVLKSLIIFTSGIAIGSVGTFLSIKNYYRFKADMEIASVKDAYNRHMEEVEPKKSSVDGEIKGPDTIEDAEPGVIKVKSSYMNSALNNKPPLTDYAKMFRSRDASEEMIEEELAENESPEDDEEMTEEEDIASQEDYEMYKINEDHKKAMEENRPPYIIDVSDFEMTCAHYPKITLHYYVEDDIVLTDDDEVVNIPDVLGDCLDTSGFRDNDDDLLHVRNDRLCADYEIEKLYTQFPG